MLKHMVFSRGIKRLVGYGMGLELGLADEAIAS
jgi:hypothetical protein